MNGSTILIVAANITKAPGALFESVFAIRIGVVNLSPLLVDVFRSCSGIFDLLNGTFVAVVSLLYTDVVWISVTISVAVLLTPLVGRS